MPNPPHTASLMHLAKAPLFKALEKSALERIAATCTMHETQKGEVLFQQGDQSDAFYLLVQGTAMLSILSEDGHELIIHIARDGAGFGEVSLLDGLPRTATCTIRDPGRVIRLDRATFLSQLDTPGVARALIPELCRMLRSANNTIELLAHKPLRSRLATMLLANAAPGSPPQVRLTQQELADLCAAARPRVNQLLKAFEADGVIGKAGRTILLANTDALREIADETSES